MKNAKKLLKSRRLVAMLLCLCMIISLFGGYRIAVSAAPDHTANVTKDATRQADPSTMDKYKDVLDFTENTRYAGRLWSDKSVFAYDTADAANDWSDNVLTLKLEDDGVGGTINLDADFLHVYSVLGSSVRVDEPVPVDLVLALDISGSMNSPEANEDENWINTADPRNADTFSQSLGFYKGSSDGSITGVVQAAQNEYSGYASDSNGIPDAIVPVLPAGVARTQDSGQMSSLTNYNNYLKFCNDLVDRLKLDSESDNQITEDEATKISSDLGTVANTAKCNIDDINAENYTKIYQAYQAYIAKANTRSDPWKSDKTNGNALWPDDGWIRAMKDAGVFKNDKNEDVVPANPMKNSNNAPNRMYYMIDAANSFIDKFLSLNEKNRISVVVYDSVATVLMPLAHYEKDNGADYLSAQKHHWQQWGGTGQWASTVSVKARPINGYENNIFGNNLQNGVYTAFVTSWTNTGTAIALNAGLDILAESVDSYGDMAKRLPALILMTDGAANIATTGLEANASLPAVDGEKKIIFDEKWIQGAADSTTSGSNVFNTYDNKGHALEGISDETLGGLTVYGANNGHIYGSEGDANTRYAVVMNTLMSTAYKKDQVEKHYNIEEHYPYNNEAARSEWTKANIYTIGFGLDYYTGIDGICGNILDPKKNFGGQSIENEEDTTKREAYIAAYNNVIGAYNTWKNGDEILDIAFDTNNPSGVSGTLHFTIGGTEEFRNDIDRNIKYNTEYYPANMKGSNDNVLAGVFDSILGLIQNEMFTPVGGSNDLGVEDSVTYMDPIGKYMEVKGVKNLLLFGELHNIVKTAVYDYSFNDEYMKKHDIAGKDFENGWYKRENGEIIKATGSGASWDSGWEYHVNTATAEQFLPNETEIKIDRPSSKIQNTTYTIYRLDMPDADRNQLRMNPAYGTEVPKNAIDDNSADPNYYTKIPGVYKLSDLRIWVEDTGDYSDSTLGSSGTESDTNFDQALYVNLPVNMLPLRTVVLTPTAEGGYDYTTNLNAGSEGYSASFPLRVFYTVGVEESVLNADRSVNITGGISAEYLNENRINTEAAASEKGRNLGSGNLEFFSNWYNPLNRYTAYAISNNDYTYGDPVVSFSPDADNRYYVFEKSLPVYSEAYQYTGDQWKRVELSDLGTDTDGKLAPNSFGGKLLAFDLEPAAETSEGILNALNEKGIASIAKDDIVLLKNALIEDSRNVHRHDENGQVITSETETDFTSTDYYFLVLEYFELHGSNATPVRYVVARKGSEFGSAYTAAGLSNGELLCWYDASGMNSEIYPYLSATETGIKDRGKSYIGYKNIYSADGKPKNLADMTDQKEDAEAIQNNGTWVIAAKVGGLRVGDLAKDVQSKGGTYADYSEDFLNERYEGYTSLTWHYCGDNTTRTANNYYVPTISAVTNSGSADSAAAAAIVNTYLGNNGRLWIPAPPSVSLTKTVVVEVKENEKPASIDETEFNYQVYIEGFTGDRDAIVLRYDATSKSWQNQLHYIDLELDSKFFLQTKDGQKAMVDANGKLVFSSRNGYVYVDSGEEYKDTIYYVYIGTNNDSATAMRVYNNSLVDNNSISKDKIIVRDKAGNEMEGEDIDKYNGMRKFYAAQVWLVPVDNYEDFSSPDTSNSTKIENFELLTLEPKANDSNSANMVINSSYRTVSSYWTKTLNFGCDAELYDKDHSIAANTAEVTLKNGYGLLFSGMESGAKYCFTEKLDDNYIDRGYSFDHIDHIVNEGDTKKYEINGFTDEDPVNFQKADHVYSVFGTVSGSFEQSGHYYNRWNADKTETQINGQSEGIEPSEEGGNTYPGVQVGDEITYEIKWANNTGQKANVVITDPLDNGVDFVKAGENVEGKYCPTAEEATTAAGFEVTTDHTVVWNLGEQEIDASGTVTLTVKVNENAPEYWDYDQDGVGDAPVDDFEVRNRATVRVAGHEYNTNTVVNPLGQPSKTETAVERGEQAPDKTDLSIAKDDLMPREDGKLHGPLVYVGDKITYEIEWQNYRNEEATVTIRDPLDSNVKFISASSDSSYNEEKHEIIWNLGKQPAGAKGKVTLVVEVLESALPVGFVDNTAFVQINNESEMKTVTIENPIPHEEKTEVTPGDGVMLQIGDEITYQIKWHNYQDDEATVIIMDTLDPGVGFVGASDGGVHYDIKDALENGSESIDIPAHTVVWELGEQPANAEGIVTLTVEVNENAKVEYKYNDAADGLEEQGTGKDYEVLNQARVKVGNDSFIKTQIVENPIPEKTESEVNHADTTLGRESNIVLTPKEDEKNTYVGPLVFVGDVITYEIHWTNGHDEEADVVITDKLDPGVDFVKEGEDNNREYNQESHTVTWTLKKQPAHASGTVKLQVKVNAKATETEDGIVVNQAQVKVGTDPTVKTEIIENPTPKEEKEEKTPGEGMQVMPGDEIEYEIKWHNYQTEAADVVITDKLDPGVDFLSAFITDEIKIEVVESSLDEDETEEEINLFEDEDEESEEEEGADIDGSENGDNTDSDDENNNSDDEDTDGDDTNPDSGTIDSNGGETIDSNDGDSNSGDEEINPDENEDRSTEVLELRTNSRFLTSRLLFDKKDKPDAGIVFLSAVSRENMEQNKTSEQGNEEKKETDPADKKDGEDSTDKKEETDPADKKDGEDSDNKKDETDPADKKDGEDSDDKKDETDPADKKDGEDSAGTEDGEEVEEEPAEGEEELEDSLTSLANKQEEKDSLVVLADPKKEFTDKYGNIIIEYVEYDEATDEATHTVKWTLKNRPAGSDGVVYLKVKVNEDAEKLWNYDNPENGPSDTVNDDRVLNQAGVKVGNDPEIKTRIIENPTKPNKTETEINDRDVSRDLVADENGYVGPNVYVGDKITYMITWQNNASDKEGNPAKAIITITDVLDQGVDFKAASDGGVYDKELHKVTWNLGEQDARVRGYVTLTVEVNNNAVDSGQVENKAAVKVGDNPEQETDKITNPVKTSGSLTVKKIVEGDQVDVSKDWNFRVELRDTSITGTYGDMLFTNGVAEFTLKHGESKTATGLPVGILYNVTEQEANRDNYKTYATGDSGVIPEGREAIAEFVNSTDETPPPEEGFGNLQVIKRVTGNAGDRNKEWHFRVKLDDTNINDTYGGMTFTDGVAEFTLKHGESMTAKNLPQGIGYTVTEQEASQDNYKTSATGDSGVIPNRGTAVAVFVNSKDSTPPPGDKTPPPEDETPPPKDVTPTPPPPEYKYGNLQVTKTVTGSAGDKNKEWHFRVELSDTKISGQYGDMFFTDGIAEFTLKHGEKKTATGLPEKVTYVVTEQEANKDGYTTSSTGEKGTIVSGQNKAASFVNNKQPTAYGNPRTGDNSHLGMWIALMAASMFGILFNCMSLYRGRRSYRGRNTRR